MIGHMCITILQLRLLFCSSNSRERNSDSTVSSGTQLSLVRQLHSCTSTAHNLIANTQSQVEIGILTAEENTGGERMRKRVSIRVYNTICFDRDLSPGPPLNHHPT